MEGLRRLEYRGYDSAGIALVDDQGDLFVEKRAGKLANLATAIAERTPHAAVGLAHTRWATHGRPSDINAHPQVDCTGRITVIHNGIIENFQALRDGLEARGHTLVSETDTEAIAHLIEEAYDGDIAEAARTALRQLHGAYALAIMHRDENDRLVGARKDVPLVVGLGEGESFLASDVAAILAHTRRVIFLEEGDVADLRPGGVVITDVEGRPRGARARDDRMDGRGRREGRLRHLHAQGDPRAARGASAVPHGAAPARGPDPGRRSSSRSSAPSQTATRVEFVACGTAVVRGDDRRGGDPGLHRPPGPRDRRLGVPLQPAAARRAHARDRGHAVRRDRRHDRPDAACARAGLPDHRGDEHRSDRRSPARPTRSCSSRRAPRWPWPPARPS